MNLYGNKVINVNVEELLEETLFMYFIINNNPRSYKDTFILDKITSNEIKEENILGHLKKEQPEQRTKEWYEFRHNRLQQVIYKIRYTIISKQFNTKKMALLMFRNIM